MLPAALRALSALAAAILFLGSVAALVFTAEPLWVLGLFAAAGLAMLSMFTGGVPSADDIPRIEAQLHRFRGAMFACFAAAALALVARSSSLGVALWLVAFVLMFFVVYYRAQRRMAAAR